MPQIPALPNASTLTGAELVPIEQGSTTVKATTQNIEVVPFQKGMDMGGGWTLKGGKSTAILEQNIDDITRVQMHIHNYGPGAIDVHPSSGIHVPPNNRFIPYSRLILDDLTKK